MTTSLALIGGDRPVRGCDVCGGVDDHPRHTIAGNRGAAGPPLPGIVAKTFENLQAGGFDPAVRDAVLAGILDDSSQDRHRDCCRAVGCPTRTCDDVANLVGEEARGAALLDATMAHADLIETRTADWLEG